MSSLVSSNWTVATIVADIMEVRLLKVIGVWDSDAKIIACYYEILFGEMKYRDVAKKYSINLKYMSKRLSELGERLTEEPGLKKKMKSIGRMLLNNEEYKSHA